MAYVPITGYGGYGMMNIGPIVGFFRSRGALSESKAIVMTSLDWAEAGLLSDPTTTRFNTIYKMMVKKTPEGKYWLDVSGIDAFMAKTRRDFRIVFNILGGLLLACGIFGIFIAILGGEAGDFAVSVMFLVMGACGLLAAKFLKVI